MTESYPVRGISLEAPGFTPYAHGYHHEFALMKSNPWLENMLGLCFCEHCVAGAEQAGIDARRFKAEVAADIGAYLDSDIDYPARYGRGVLARRHRGRRRLARAISISATSVVTSLVAEIRAAVRADANVAVIPSVARPTGGAWYEGSDLARAGRNHRHHRGMFL